MAFPETAGTEPTAVGVLGGAVAGNETMLPARCATNHRVLSPGICAIIIGACRFTFAKTCSNFTGAVLGGRVCARQVVFEGRVSRPNSARVGGT